MSKPDDTLRETHRLLHDVRLDYLQAVQQADDAFLAQVFGPVVEDEQDTEEVVA